MIREFDQTVSMCFNTKKLIRAILCYSIGPVLWTAPLLWTNKDYSLRSHPNHLGFFIWFSIYALVNYAKADLNPMSSSCYRISTVMEFVQLCIVQLLYID